MVAQVNNPFGFQMYKAGVDPEDLVECYSSNSDIIGLGDAVVLAGSYEGDSGMPKRPTVARAAATGGLYGVVVGISQHMVSDSNQNLSRRHKPASVGMYMQVMPFKLGDVYKIQADGAVAVTNVGNVALLATISDADTTTGLSKMQLSASSLATGQTAYQMTVIGFPEDANVTYNTAYQEVLVTINNIQGFHAFGGV